MRQLPLLDLMKTELVVMNETFLTSLPVAEWEDGVARVRDTDLGEWLGYKEPRAVRKLVQRHLETLGEFGEVRDTVSQTTEKGGRPTTMFDLNRDQAVYITSQCGTPKARALTVYVVRVNNLSVRG